MKTRLLMGGFVALLVWAAVCAAVIVALDRHEQPRLYRFCNGHMQQVARVEPCPDGHLAVVA